MMEICEIFTQPTANLAKSGEKMLGGGDTVPPQDFWETDLKFSYDHENFFGDNNLYL